MQLIDGVHLIQVSLYSRVVCEKKPERARYERARAFDTNGELIQPCTKNFLSLGQFITRETKIFIEIVF